jgi:nicotinate dehydrogenase subunit B
MHGALGPSAAAALWEGGRLTVWSHTQGPFQLRAALAQALEMDESAIRVIHVEGPGCYGHNGADDAGLDAALCALARPGRPVLLQWSQADEHRWEPYGPAMAVQMKASLDGNGRVMAWNHDVWSYTHSGRPRRMEGASNLLASWHKADGLPRPPARAGRGTHGGSHRNADPLYAFPARRIVKHSVPNSPLRTSSLRALGAFANVFAIESFMDELAQAAGMDPVAFRLAHLNDERGRAVVQAAADFAGWQAGQGSQGDGQGRGFGFARYKNEKCYAAVVADVQVDRASGLIRVEKLTIAADAGQIIGSGYLLTDRTPNRVVVVEIELQHCFVEKV